MCITVSCARSRVLDMSFAVLTFVNVSGHYEAAARLNAHLSREELELAKDQLLRRLHYVGVLPAAMWVTIHVIDASLSSLGDVVLEGEHLVIEG